MSFFHGVIITLTILNIIIYYLRQRKEEEEEKEEEGEEEYGERGEDSSSSLRHLSCRRFSLDHIRLATNNFDESLVIGEGGFGKVYKGIIDAGADPVAIKRLSFSSSQGVTEFRTELELLSKFRHSHLVSLIGYCQARREMILVYEYMPAGSLSDHLHKDRRLKSGHSPLPWVHRLNICVDAARGLDYLHTGTSIKERVIHRDVKSSNILLDENFAAKISDFGLSRIAPVNPRSTNCDYTDRNIGTFGYMDIESFYTRKVTRKSDVYAFGVVLFEALCGRPAVDSSLDEEQWGLAGWAKICVREGTITQIMDPFIKGEILPGCLDEFVQIAYKCLHDRSKNRPTMAYVVARLESALAIQEGRDVVARVESGLALLQGRSSPVLEQQVANPATSHPVAVHDKHWTGSFTKRNRKIGFSRKMLSLFYPKLLAVSAESSMLEDMDEVSAIKSLQYNFSTIRRATEDFSKKNVHDVDFLGAVYKGRLRDGQDIAVRWLSNTEGQDDIEFKKEVALLARLRHKNLIRLLGFCSTKAQKLLIYESMPNPNLYHLLFGETEHANLNWHSRSKIIDGIAKGLSYLHENSGQRIIHGNLNARCILFDAEMNPKIADLYTEWFLAFNQSRGAVTHISAPIGYMAPEYAIYGRSSVKTDIFSFGVLILEIVMGKQDFPNLLNHAWKNWQQGTTLDILDPKLRDGSGSLYDMMRKIHIGLLCVQEKEADRPIIGSVVNMLNNFLLELPPPSSPAY